MTTREDSYKHKGWRKTMIKELEQKNIASKKVLDAMNEVPRHYLLDPAFDHLAYEDRSIPIAAEQTISQPSTVAFQTELLNVQAGEKILEVGTGSGYQSFVLAALGARVYTIERQKNLYTQLQADNPLQKKYASIKYFYGDGFAGLPLHAPFAKIIITCGAPIIPDALIKQLCINGVMVIPHDEGDKQRMKKLTKTTEDIIEIEDFGLFQFVPMLEGKGMK